MATETTYYTEYQVPATLESRVLIPALQSLLVAVAVTVIILALLFFVPWPEDPLPALGALGQRLGCAVVIGLSVAAPVLPWLLNRANKGDVRRRYLHLLPEALDLDANGVVEADEVATVQQLFTEDGLVEFVREVVYRRGDWTYRGLVPQYLTRQLYDLLIGDILPTMGILEPRGERLTAHRARDENGRPLTEAEAEACIREYLTRPNRRFWSLDIQTEIGPVRIRL